MQKRWPISTLILLLVLAACQTAENGAFGTRRRAASGALIRPVSSTVFVTVGELAADPPSWSDTAVETSGIYRSQPLVVCSGVARRSPATWYLVDGNDRIPAGGFDAVLRALNRTDVELTVVGRWLWWEGPVGCGKKAVPRSFWYLAVDEIIAPNPLFRTAVGDLPATPGGGVGGPPLLGTPDPAPGATAVGQVPPPGAITPSPTTASPPTPSSTPLPTIVTPTSTPTTTPTPLPLETPTAETTVTPPPDATETVSSTPSDTPPPGSTPTATSTPGASATNTPTPTRTPSSGPIDVGDLEPQAIGKSNFEGGDVHRWEFVLDGPDQISISIAPAVDLNIRFSILDENETMLVAIDDGGLGQVEGIEGYPLGSAGRYFVDIAEVNGAAGNYAILFLLSTSFQFVMQPTLSYGETASTSLPTDVDHFWNFDGEDGDVITIVVSPDANANIFVELFSPEMEVIARRISQDGRGQVREIVNFTLPDTGFFTIRVGEFDFGPAVYTISLSGPP